MTATATLERPIAAPPILAARTEERGLRASEAKPGAALRRRQKQELSRRAKEACSRFLARRGYQVLERDWKCKAGTADIVCRDGYSGAIVFAEVKANLDKFPPDAITPKRRERLEAIAIAYLTEHPMQEASVRFDVLSLVALGKNFALIRHHANALDEA